jgi:hypothetical protein
MGPRSPADETDDTPAHALDDLDDELFDPHLLDPAAWKDDDDVAVLSDVLPEEPDLSDTDALDPHEWEGDHPDPRGDANPPLDDDLDDLTAEDDREPVVLSFTPRVEIVRNGSTVPVPARVEPWRARSVWETPGDAGADPTDVDVVLVVEGRRIPAALRRAAAEVERILLGRDVLSGRFLLKL